MREVFVPIIKEIITNGIKREFVMIYVISQIGYILMYKIDQFPILLHAIKKQFQTFHLFCRNFFEISDPIDKIIIIFMKDLLKFITK